MTGAACGVENDYPSGVIFYNKTKNKTEWAPNSQKIENEGTFKRMNN